LRSQIAISNQWRRGPPRLALSAAWRTAMFKQIIGNNRAGGWRKLKREA
jgi:hypothetical protein